MAHIAPRTLTHALVIGSFLSFGVAVVDTQAAPSMIAAQQSQSDAEITEKIRKALTDDKALAAYAQTLRITVSGGLVTLKGAVKSEADKKAIGDKVDAIAGAPNVMNNLFVSKDLPAKPQTR